MNNIINYTGLNAEIHFNAKSMSFLGVIKKDNKTYEFKALTLSELKNKYEEVSDQIHKAQEIRDELATQLISLEQIVQSGEAKIYVNKNHSELKLGMMIKMLLEISDGASFTVVEKLSGQPNSGASL